MTAETATQLDPEREAQEPIANTGSDVGVQFKEWVVLELMGHVRRIGLATEAELFGGKLLRLDALGEDGEITGTQYYGANAIYCMTPVTKERAMEIVQPYRPERRRLEARDDDDQDELGF